MSGREEQFCDDCHAGTESNEHHEKCVTALDLLGIAPGFTGGLSVDEYMDEQRGRGQR